jgi:hypothetical protein
MTLALLSSATAVGAGEANLTEARRALQAKDFRTAAALAGDEVKANPGNEEAYIVLAEAQEGQGDKVQAAATWDQLKKITSVRERVQLARQGLLRTRGPEAPEYKPGEDTWESNPYKVDVGKLPWEKLREEVQGISVQYQQEMPPARLESPYFEVFAATDRAAEVITHLCEKYTQFLLDKYFHADQEWALRIPIIIYKDHNDYVNIGKYPAASAGVTASDIKTGVPVLIALFMLDENGALDHEALEGTLPHELTHMVVHEWFGGAAEIPRWIDEGLARRMEQSRNHYAEAAKIGRDAVAGEYFRFRELFAMEQYPSRGDRTFRFYEQSATIVLFLLEHFGPDAAVAFFEALRAGGTHDDAAAAAMGIPVEGAVDEMEKRWVEWARQLYVRFADRLNEGEIAQGTALDEAAFVTSFAELETADKVKSWNTIRTDSMNAFKDIGGSHRHWKSEGGKLLCQMKDSEIGSLVGIRTNDDVPMVLKFSVRAPEASVDTPTVLGIALLDYRSDDTGLHVSVPLEDRREHNIQCVVSDEIALYVDGVCTGRAPAVRDLKEDLDWPLAYVGYGPLEISSVQTAAIEEFVPLAQAAPQTP